MTDNKGKVRAHQLHALRAHAHRLTLWFAGSLLALACSVGLTAWAIALRHPVAALAGAATGFAAGLWSFASWLLLACTRRDIRHGRLHRGRKRQTVSHPRARGAGGHTPALIREERKPGKPHLPLSQPDSPARTRHA